MFIWSTISWMTFKYWLSHKNDKGGKLSLSKCIKIWEKWQPGSVKASYIINFIQHSTMHITAYSVTPTSLHKANMTGYTVRHMEVCRMVLAIYRHRSQNPLEYIGSHMLQLQTTMIHHENIYTHSCFNGRNVCSRYITPIYSLPEREKEALCRWFAVCG